MPSAEGRPRGRGRGRGQGQGRPHDRRATVERSEVERLEVERLVAGGDGLAREAGGRVVFVPGTLPGEVVDVRLVSAKRDFARGELIDVVTPSPARTAPPCPALARGCGGCDWQHVDPAAQLDLKVGIVREAMRRTARLPDAAVVAGGVVAPWGYRTSMRFAVDASGRPALRRARSNDTVELDGCPVAHPALAAMLPGLRIPGADEVSLRVSAATGERSAWWTPAEAVAEGLAADVVTGAEASVTEVVGGATLRVSSASFFQSGPQAAELLVRTVRSACADDLAAARTVIDAYGGGGLFSATVVDEPALAVVVEGSPAAVADARVNLRDRSARVVESAVEQWQPEPADLVIADPSRQGLGAAAVDRLGATGAPVLVLVSCDPVALARDTTLLAAAGWAHRSTVVLDLFPNTHHVEAVTRFERVTS